MNNTYLFSLLIIIIPLLIYLFFDRDHWFRWVLGSVCLGSIAMIVLGVLGWKNIIHLNIANNGYDALFGSGVAILSLIFISSIIFLCFILFKPDDNGNTISNLKTLNQNEDNWFYLIIDNKQDISNSKLNNLLKKMALEVSRERIYLKDEFKNHIENEQTPYIFLSSQEREDLETASINLKNNNVNAYIIDNEQFEQLVEETNPKEEKSNKNSKKNKKNKSTNNVKDILSFEKLNNFDEYFNNKIIGQNNAVNKIKQNLIEKSYDLGDSNRPLGIFLFVGPTGVGKTELCKQLSEFLYNNKKINRFDMSEYKGEVSIQKLIGAPNGYVGYEEGGLLTNALEQNPNAILLFDEIEKADKNIFDLFLQMFDEGVVTDNKGKKYYLKNNFIILTSNIGANLINKNDSYEDISNKIQNEVNDFFSYELNRPEILGRIGKDNIIVFNTIKSKTDQYKILDIYFNNWKNELNNNHTSINFDIKNIYDEILKKIDTTKGARDIRNQFIEFKKHFTKALFENKLKIENIKNKNIDFNYSNGIVTIINISEITK